MQITIDSTNVALDDAMREYIERRLRFAFTRFSPQVKGIQLSVEHSGRPSSRSDISCKIRVKLMPIKEVKIEIHDAEIRSAIARAVDRAGHAVERNVEQQRGS